MRKLSATSIVLFVAGVCVGGSLVRPVEGQARARGTEKQSVTGSRGAITKQPTTLGAFSVSLTVKDLQASRAFYEKLDFEVVGGDAAQNWLILRNGVVTVGLFHGMFGRNTFTFNPGWDQNAQAIDLFTDVREHQRRLKSSGLTLTSEADEKGKGPARFTLADPDGNPILIDQHAPASLQPPANRKRD
jgi:catechol 2,3-dioxygenase-like lactoylglutathione lyase family enzyme